MKKPQISASSFWQTFIKRYPHKHIEIEALQKFIQAPDNGFLLAEILRRFIELEKNINIGIQPVENLSVFIGTAKWMLAEIISNFRPNDPSYFHLYFDAYIDRVLALNVGSEDLKDLEKFIHGNLLHSHKKKNALYTCLFFPYISDKAMLHANASLIKSLEVHQFIKAQSFKLLANMTIPLHPSSLYEFSSALIKIITLDKYDHLNITGYELMDSPEKLYYAIAQDSKDDEQLLEDKIKSTQRIQKKRSNLLDETATNEGIERSKVRLMRFFGRLFKNKMAKELTQSDTSSERGNYNRRMGLVALDKSFKEKYAYVEKDFSGINGAQNLKVRSIKIPKSATENFQYAEYGDEIDSETDTLDLSWIQSENCELKNPIAKLIHAKRMAPHIAFSNQQLKSRLPTTVINQILNHIQDSIHDIRNNGRLNYEVGVRKTLLSLLLSLLFCRHFNSISFNLNDIKNDLNCLKLNHNCSKAWLKIPQYHNEFYLAHPELYLKARVGFIEFVLPQQVQSLLLPLIHSLKQDGELRSSSTLYLPTKKVIQTYLSNHNNLSYKLSRLIDAVARNYDLLSMSDSWMMAIFSGNEIGLQKTQKHYASVPLRKTQRIFEKHCSSFLNLKISCYVGFNRMKDRVGSPYYINSEVFRLMVTTLRELGEPLMEHLKFDLARVHELVLRFNALAIYTELFCAFSCAIRNIYDPIVDIDFVSKKGLFRVNDKNIHDGFNTRITYVPPSLFQTLAQYRLIRRKVLVALKKAKLIKKSNSTLLKENELIYLTIDEKDIQINRYSRVSAREAFWRQALEAQDLHPGIPKLHLLTHLKTNANRHYLRGRLLELGVLGHYIDAYLGHWHLGTQPWGQMSLFDHSAYVATMTKHIPPILTELGFSTLNEGQVQ